ncbi:hypothetical protein [Kibdelosporangium aridum]|nr:hypothetical protein [Kibdelosporangium aridum]
MRSLLAMVGWQIRVLVWPRCLKSLWLVVVLSEDRARRVPRRLGLAVRDLPGKLGRQIRVLAWPRCLKRLRMRSLLRIRGWQNCVLGWLRCLNSLRLSVVLSRSGRASRNLSPRLGGDRSPTRILQPRTAPSPIYGIGGRVGGVVIGGAGVVRTQARVRNAVRARPLRLTVTPKLTPRTSA